MRVEGLHEKGIFTEDFPFRLAVNTHEDFDYPLHWHSAIELVYILENEYTVNLNGRELHLDERDILFISGGEIHGFHMRHTKGKRFFIQFDLSLLDGFGGIHNLKPLLSRCRRVSCLNDGTLHQAIEEQILTLIAEYEKKEFAYALAVNARIYDILIILCRSILEKFDAEGMDGNRKRISGLDRINRAFEYIEEHYLSEITLKDVSRAAGFSEYHFSRIFKEVTEKNFHRYLNEFRIKKAEKLLLNMDKTIAQIAHEAGFNSIVTFNRIFKEMKGCAPTSYRNLCG